MQAQRYAVYYTPDGALADFGAEWLGWDLRGGREVEQPQIDGLDLPSLTKAPRRYGFHATIKPPFRLAEGSSEGQLADALETLAGRLAPAHADGLKLAQLGRFLALVPEGDTSAIGALAAQTVAALDTFRAPAGPEEIARRRASGLSTAQDANLLRWGYPYVMEEFRFHMTLSDSLDADPRERLAEAVAPRVTPLLPRPFRLDALSLLGEGEDGRFRLIHRYALTG